MNFEHQRPQHSKKFKLTCLQNNRLQSKATSVHTRVRHHMTRGLTELTADD